MVAADRMLEILNKSLAELQQYTDVYNTQVKQKREEHITKNIDNYKKDPNSVDLGVIAKEVFYMNGFHQLDIRRLQTTFLNNYNLFKALEPEIKVSDEVEAVASILKVNLGSQMFTVSDGTFKEIIADSVKEALEKYEANNYFKLFESQILKLFNEQYN